MFILNRKRYLSSLVLTVITLMTATACSTTQQVKETNSISIERVDSDKASISHAYLSGENTLKGTVTKKQSSRGPIPGHLHITLIDPQGNIMKEADMSYTRRTAKSSRAFFSAELPIDLSTGSTIRITHFTRKTHEPIPTEPNWRDAQH